MARISHVELRSRRYAARQYVSETHWHKPDAPTRQIAHDETVTPTEETDHAGPTE